MKRLKLLLSSAAIMAGLFATQVSADMISPGGNANGLGTATFGDLNPATFGGTGIPHDDVQITQIGNLVLGLSATQRYDNPPLTNDGVGTFQAMTGGDTGNGKPGYATWNFDFYVSGIGQGQTTKLWIDKDPAMGNNVSDFISLGGYNIQDSWNLGMNFIPGAIMFDPTAIGQYDFKLAVYNSLGVEVGNSSIRVNAGSGGTNSVPDSGATVAMLGVGLAGMGLIRRKMGKSTGQLALSAC